MSWLPGAVDGVRRREFGVAYADVGNDHRIFRLGHKLSVRLPTADGYVPQVDQEQIWLRGSHCSCRYAGRASAYFPAPRGRCTGGSPTGDQFATDTSRDLTL